MKSLQLGVLAALMFACGSSSDKKNDETNQTAAETSQDVGATNQNTEGTVDNSAPANGNADAGTEETNVSKPAEVIAFEVNATDKVNFAGFDLDGNKAVADITSDASWDIAFKRTAVKVQNPAVAVATIKGKTFDEVSEVPADAEFVSDAPVDGGSETAGLVFHAGDAWYAYDMDTHVIKSRNYVYLVKSSEGSIFKVALTDYYNADRLSGYIQVKSQLLKAAE